MNFFNKEELLNALLNLEVMLPNLDKTRCNPLKEITLFFDIECDFYQADRGAIEKMDKADCLYKIWDESRVCDELSAEMTILSCLCDLLKLLDIPYNDFDEFLDDIEGKVET